MDKFKKKNIKEICHEVDLIIAGTDNKVDYQYLYMHLENALSKKISYDDIVMLCEATLKIAITKNRKIRHLEKDFWYSIKDIPLRIMMFQEIEASEGEELLSNTKYDNRVKRMLSRLLGLVLEILELKDDSSKGSELRRTGSLSVVGGLSSYYDVPIAKRLLLGSVQSKNKREQYSALEGLARYYEVSEDEIEEDLVVTLNEIKNETDDREVASTCLQVQINAGIIDEGTALYEMDDWKDEHYY